MVPCVVEFAAQPGHQVTGGFFGFRTAQDGNEPRAPDFDLVAEIRPGRKGGVARGPAVFLFHPPSLVSGRLPKANFPGTLAPDAVEYRHLAWGNGGRLGFRSPPGRRPAKAKQRGVNHGENIQGHRI